MCEVDNYVKKKLIYLGIVVVSMAKKRNNLKDLLRITGKERAPSMKEIVKDYKSGEEQTGMLRKLLRPLWFVQGERKSRRRKVYK